MESYRNLEDRVCHRTLLNVGFLPEVSAEQLNAIRTQLNNLYSSQSTLFEEADPVVKELASHFWKRLIADKKIDPEKAQRQVTIDTIKHSNVREVGAEWIGYNTWNQLQLTEFLQTQGWSDNKIQLAATQVISRAVYPASELKTSQWIKENSAICEVTGYAMEQMTKDKLYQSASTLR